MVATPREEDIPEYGIRIQRLLVANLGVKFLQIRHC